MESIGDPIWIGPYRLTSRIATGGMAEIYLGRHITEDGSFGPIVAVKRLLPHLVKDSAIVRMFLNEARITAQIGHPNVVKIYELGQVDGEPFIAMELLEGRTWAELRQRAAENGRRMPVGVALTVLTEACRGLDAAHRAVDENGKPLSLVHRDFTPDNIHVGVSGDVKVIDFGIARTTAWGAGTEPGTLKGKFFYMSPEMITAKPVDHRADIFAAGVMLYEQLCGRRPFTGTSIDEVVIRIAREDPALPSAYDPAVPRALEAICLRAIAKDPRNRYQTLGEFVDAIVAVGGDSVLATKEEVSAYVSSIFPEKSDERRQTLRRAREADPSVPSGRPPADLQRPPLESTVPSPIRAYQPGDAPPLDDGGEGPTAVARRPDAASASAKAQPTPAQQPAAAEPRPPRKLGLPLGLAAVAIVAVIAVVALRKPQLSPAEALTRAEVAQGDARGELLANLATHPEVTEGQLQKAAELLTDAKQWEASLTLCDAWLLKAPKSLDARLLEARAAVEVRKGKRAEAAIKAAAELAPNDARPDALLARLKELQAETGAALESWTRAASKAPGNAEYLARQGYWLSQAGRLEEAEAALNKANRKKHDPATTAELGFVKFRKEQVDEALKLLRASVKEKPDQLEAQYYLGAVLFRKNDLAGARAAYLAADAVAGPDQRPLMALCEMEQMQQTPELPAVQKKLKERFPKEADSLLSKCASAAPPPAE